jgi:transcriptional regulator with XRE-family HTH domain
VTRQGWTHLGEIIQRERKRRRLTQAQFADAIGLKPRTISNIERAAKESYDPSTIDAIELAMRWQVGSVDRVVNGQSPILEREAEDALTERMRELWPRLSPDAREAVVRIVELLARS